MADGNGKLSEETLQQLKAKYGVGGIVSVSTPIGDIAVGRPPQAVWDRWVEQASGDPKGRPQALRMLTLGCLEYPDQAAAERILSTYPGLTSKLANALTELAGAGDSFEIKVE